MIHTSFTTGIFHYALEQLTASVIDPYIFYLTLAKFMRK